MRASPQAEQKRASGARGPAQLRQRPSSSGTGAWEALMPWGAGAKEGAVSFLFLGSEGGMLAPPKGSEGRSGWRELAMVALEPRSIGSGIMSDLSALPDAVGLP